MSKRLIVVGEKLRAARREQRLSLRELAVRANVSASLLSQIESGKVTPSAASLWEIATALELPVHAFFPQAGESDHPTTLTDKKIAEEQPAYAVTGTRSLAQTIAPEHVQATAGPVVRASARMMIELMGGVTWARLTPEPEEGMEFLEIRYPPGYSAGPEMLHHTGREFGVVIEGELLIDLAFERHILRVGDSIIYDSSVPHRCANASSGTTRAFWVRFTPRH